MCIRDSYYTYPDDWTDSFSGVRDALSNLLTYGSNGNQVTAKDRAAAKALSLIHILKTTLEESFRAR